MNTDRLVQIAQALPGAIAERSQALHQMQAHLDDLTQRSCNGTEYWRNKDHPTREPKMYVNHGLDQVCNVHGKPSPGDRLRVYVGSDPDKQTETRQLMENEKERQVIHRQVAQLERALNRLDWRMGQLFESVGYTYPDNGQVPEPDANWTPQQW